MLQVDLQILWKRPFCRRQHVQMSLNREKTCCFMPSAIAPAYQCFYYLKLLCVLPKKKHTNPVRTLFSLQWYPTQYAREMVSQSSEYNTKSLLYVASTILILNSSIPNLLNILSYKAILDFLRCCYFFCFCYMQLWHLLSHLWEIMLTYLFCSILLSYVKLHLTK